MQMPEAHPDPSRPAAGDLPGWAIAVAFIAVTAAVSYRSYPSAAAAVRLHQPSGDLPCGRRHRQRPRSPALLPDRMAADPRSDDGPGGAGPAPLHGHLPGGPHLHDLDLRRHPVRHARAPPRPLGPLVGAAAPRRPAPLQRRAPGRGHELSVRHRLGAVGASPPGWRCASGPWPWRYAVSTRSCWRCSSAICSRSVSMAWSCWRSKSIGCGPPRLDRKGRGGAACHRLRRDRGAVSAGLAAADHRPDLGTRPAFPPIGTWPERSTG